jgi:hypothetical protein
LVNMKVPGPFERVSVDILGPLPVTTNGNRYILCSLTTVLGGPYWFPLK